MKKNNLALILAFAATAAMAVQPDSTDSNLRYEVKITNGEAILMSGAVVGSGSSLSAKKTQSYLKSCDEPAASVTSLPPPIRPASMQLTAGEFTTGTKASLARDISFSSNDMFVFDWHIDQLESMAKSHAGACDVEIPLVAHYDGLVHVKLSVGETSVFDVFGTDTYKIALMRTR